MTPCLVTIVALALGASPRSAVHEALRAQCLSQAADPHNPWALAHGITGLGRDFAVADGRRASDVIIHDYLKKSGFDRFAADQTPIEPHANLITKTLLLAGFPLATEFKTSWGKISLRELVEGVESGFRAPAAEEEWRDAAWTLDLLGEVLKPGAPAHFRGGAGVDVDLNRVMDDSLSYLEAAQATLASGMDRRLKSVPKDKQGIYSHSCGGMHFIQAVDHWARYPEVRTHWGVRWTRQVDVLFYRLESERQQYDSALGQFPQYKLELLTQELKFYGHWLETVGRLVSENAYTLSPAQEQTVASAQALLEATTRELQGVHAFASMQEIKKTHYQTYLDLIGDSCHAAHGLDYWRRTLGKR